MKIASLPGNEHERLEALRNYDILDTAQETAFDNMVQLASYICKTPIAAISLVDEQRQWFKAITGIDARETPRSVAFCAHAILQDDAMIVPDATKDERFFDNPLVASAPDIRFYAGFPLITSQGYHLGTLCVIDRIPRVLDASQLDAIKVLADNVMAHLDLRLSHKHIRQYADDMKLAATIFQSSSEAMVVTDADNRIITVNPAFTKLTGYTGNEVIGKNPNLLKSDKQPKEFYQQMWHLLKTKGHWDGEVWNLRKSGQLYAEWLCINVIYNDDGSTRLYVAIFSDITEKKQADELVWKQANYDQLTHLPNRRLFRDRMAQSIKIANRSKNSFALMFIDLDRFKEINDILGHHTGDKLLQAAALRINQCVREMDTVARMGGDEFTVILSQIADPIYAGKIAGTIIRKLNDPFTIEGADIDISASIGITIYPADGDNTEQLLKNADIAMYAAKHSGRGRFSYFTLPA
ncbi:MAG: diguanylate cyclase [Proteobacteria bacterium]|nr:diguanylate cyclase [Pseudomonadota bacterium]